MEILEIIIYWPEIFIMMLPVIVALVAGCVIYYLLGNKKPSMPKWTPEVDPQPSLPMWTPGGDPPLSMIIVGKTGEGKSATGNTILGWKGFKTSPLPVSVITSSQCLEGVAGGRNVLVVDTPGVFDTLEFDSNGSNDDLIQYVKNSCTCKEIFKSFCLAITKSKNFSGVDAFILVIRLDAKFTEEDSKTYIIFKKIFGESFVKHTIVLFTHIDTVAEEVELPQNNFLEWLKSNHNDKVLTKKLESILKDCDWRTIGFNNKLERSNQAGELIKLIDKMKNENGNEPFNQEFLEIAKREIENEIEKRMKVSVEHREEVLPQIRKEISEEKSCVDWLFNLESWEKFFSICLKYLIPIAKGFKEILDIKKKVS